MACHTRWPNSDKYPDDKAEHDTLSADKDCHGPEIGQKKAVEVVFAL